MLFARAVFFAIVSTCALALAAGTSASAQPSVLDQHQRLVAAMNARDFPAADKELQAIEQISAAIYTQNNYDYLRGRLAQKRADGALAAASFEAVVRRNSLLNQYALVHLAQLARASGNLNLERDYLRKLLVLAPGATFEASVNARLARSYFESADYTAAIRMLQPRASPITSAAAREALLLLAGAYLKADLRVTAHAGFYDLISKLPDPAQPDDFALLAARELDQMDGGSNAAAPELAEAEHLRRALIYQFNRDFTGARLHYVALVQRFPSSASVPDALFQVGRGYFNERDYENALVYFSRVTDGFASSTAARDAFNFRGAAYARLGRTEAALASYKQAIALFPAALNPERPYLNIIDALRDAGQEREALDWTEQTRIRFAGQIGATLALFTRARIHIAAAEWSSALVDLKQLDGVSDLGGTRVPGGTSVNELGFLRAFVLEQLGRFQEAVAAYLALQDGRNEYFGWRATLRLQAMASDPASQAAVSQQRDRLLAIASPGPATANPEKVRLALTDALRLTTDATARVAILEQLQTVYATLPAYGHAIERSGELRTGRQMVVADRRPDAVPNSHRTLADELLFLCLYDEGAPELAADRAPDRSENFIVMPYSNAKSDNLIRQSTSTLIRRDFHAPDANPADRAYTLALAFHRGQLDQRAIAYAEPLWHNVPGDFVMDLAPTTQLDLLYPAPFRDELLRHAPTRGVDPRFILSIARQESRFRTDVKSNAAARGLMQFISATAAKVAAELGRHDFAQDELYSPDTAILFGAQYLGALFKQFPAQPQAVAASYNGGEDNMARWLARARTTAPERYVSEIGFSQSKDYVYKVLCNYRQYQNLYDEKLAHRRDWQGNDAGN